MELAVFVLSACCFLGIPSRWLTQGGSVVFSSFIFTALLIKYIMTFTTRFWSGTTVLLCGLLLQNCQSSSLSATREEEPATSPSSALAIRQSASSEPLAMRSLTSLSTPPAAHDSPASLSTTPTHKEENSTTPSTLVAMGSSLAAPYHLPAAAMPEASHGVPLSSKSDQALSPVFTASSGERVSFSQIEGQWCAALQAGYGSAALQRALPVVGSEDIEALLSRLQHQDVWASRARIHVMARPTPPYSLCVYVGKLGLLGGMPEASSEAEGATGLSLLERKLAEPGCILSESESIELLTSCVATGVKHAEQVKDKEAVIVIGDTGAGKSTFINYLLGCTMVEKAHEDAFENVVAVQPVSEGGSCDEVMPIGHEGKSKTYMPQVAPVPEGSSLLYCDCPGFLDNRGAEINIVNAVNIKHVLQAAKCVKVVVLIDYQTIRASRGHGLKETMKLCTQLFGSDAALEKFQDAVMLGVTRAPENISLEDLGRLLLRADASPIMQTLSKHVFLYDPLNRGGADFCSRDQCVSQLVDLKGIPQVASSSMFQTVLTADDEQKLIDIVEKQSETLQEKLDGEAYAEAGSCWQALQSLKVVDNVRVDRPLQSVQRRLREVASGRVNLFMDCLLREDVKEAKNHLSSLSAMSEQFDAKEDLGLDLEKLKDHYDKLLGKLLRAKIPSQAFGPQEWSKYYGEVGSAPLLPADIEATLNAPCPFWPDRKVRDTHLLVLMPAKVDGKPFTLNLLQELIRNPKSGGHKTQYRFYGDETKAQIGNNAPDGSYWLLMTRDILPESRGKWWSGQKELVAAHARRTGLPYELPKALEAITAILTHYVRSGERLYGDTPWTYTSCQELISVLPVLPRFPAVVGGFAAAGLIVYRYDYAYDHNGVAGFRKF
jgi:energy-coupling factor transporter ATP-binding protein EcfA2